MGGSLSTIRWTPYGPLPGGGAGDRHPQGSRANPLRKSKSFPPNQHGDPGRGPSPSNSTSNLSGSYDNDGGEYNEEDFLNTETRGDHLGTSGILMGVNAPPLYDACLVGRWDEVLDLCGVEREHGEEEHRSDDSPNTGTTHCSSTDEDPGFPSGDEGGRGKNNNNGGDDASTSSMGSQHPFLQTRYADRRRNTPLHLACRRQPPPPVVRALLNHSPCEAVSRRTADGLTPLHFAAYCGAGVEVVSMLVDRMRSDAAVGRAMRLSLDELDENRESDGGNNNNRSGDGRWMLPSEESALLPPTRLLDRRRRTPLHCALSGFRTPIRPLVVRKLLAVDPASATLGDERGRTPLSLLFDDYAEEIMEALEEDVPPEMARERTQKGGELHECWRMLRVLLQAAYRGSVSEDDDEGESKSLTSSLTASQQGFPAIREGCDASDNTPNKATPTPHNTPQPQDRRDHLQQTQQSSVREVNVMEMYERERFSMVHAAAGVWECPAPLAKLVLKCLCGGDRGKRRKKKAESSEDYWDHHRGMDLSDREGVEDMMDLMRGPEEGEAEEEEEDEEEDVDPIQQPDEESMRLPLHIAVCARPQGREGYSARLRVWLSSTPEMANSLQPRRTNSRSSMSSSMRSGMSLASSADRGRSATGKAAGQVYNPRFGRSPSRDSVVAYQSSQSIRRSRRAHEDRSDGGVASTPDRGYISRSGSNASITANIAREPFLQHTMVRDVLALHPAAAAAVDNRTGKLPIVLAIEHGKSWETAVGPLLDAHPHPFGGGGDGGMALPDDGPEVTGHREDLQAALFVALSSPEVHVRDEAIRTAGKLAGWGGVYGMPGSLDGIVGEWLDTMAKHSNAIAAEAAATASPPSPEGIVVGPGASSSRSVLDPFQTQSSHLTAVAEVISHSRPESVSDRVARLCLGASREYLFSKNGGVREAAARVLGNTLNSVGDADDAANVTREVVLGSATSDDGSVVTVSSKSVFGGRENEDSVIAKHGRLLACSSILSTQWGAELVATPDICDAVVIFIHGCVKDRNNAVVRSAAYHAMGPLLGKSGTAAAHYPDALSRRTATLTLREMRSDILKGTRASERADVQLALARGLTAASRMHPDLFLCRGGMPVMDAALMLAMSSSVKRPQVQKAFQIFLWVALRMGGVRGDGSGDGGGDGDGGAEDRGGGTMNSPGLEKYIELAEGENGRIMMKFVTQTLAKIEDLDDL